jgi:hypothetical protein
VLLGVSVTVEVPRLCDVETVPFFIEPLSGSVVIDEEFLNPIVWFSNVVIATLPPGAEAS